MIDNIDSSNSSTSVPNTPSKSRTRENSISSTNSSRYKSFSKNKVVYNNNNNSNNNSRKSTNININVEKQISKKLKKKSRTNSQKFWRLIGILLTTIGISLIVFTIFLGLHIDGIIDWSYWILFIPIYVIVAAGYFATTSRILSNLVSWLVRFIYRISVVGITFFVVFCILKLKYSLFKYSIMMLPILLTSGFTLLFGLYAIGYGICVNNSDGTQRRTKYLVNGFPLLYLGCILFPSCLCVALKLDGYIGIKWSVCLISLFIGDAVSSCFSFFLFIFSLGSKDTATFSIGQILSILLLTICSIVFKILLVLRLDQSYLFKGIYMFIPAILGELVVIFCGFNLFFKPPQTNYLESTGNDEESSLLNNNQVDDDDDDDDDYDEDDAENVEEENGNQKDQLYEDEKSLIESQQKKFQQQLQQQLGDNQFKQESETEYYYNADGDRNNNQYEYSAQTTSDDSQLQS